MTPSSVGYDVPCCRRCGKHPVRRWGQSWLCRRHWQPVAAFLAARAACNAARRAAAARADRAGLAARGTLDTFEAAALWECGLRVAARRLARLRELGLARAVPGTWPVRHVPVGRG
jgi:hypothetical protein